MGWENWVIGLSIAIVAIAFVCLVVFLIITLFSLKKSLRETDRLIRNTNDFVIDVEHKVRSLDPLFNVVADVSQVLEKKTEGTLSGNDLPRENARKHKIENIVNTAVDVMEWTLVGVSIWQKIKERR